MEIAEFLLARIAEDEAAAQAAIDWQGEGALPWVANGGGVDQADGSGLATYVGDDVAPHIARWDPARVLAKCAADRAVVETHERLWRRAEELRRAGRHDEAATARAIYAGVEMVLGNLALPYADHPDYNPEWKV